MPATTPKPGPVDATPRPITWLDRFQGWRDHAVVDTVVLWVIMYLGSAPPETDSGRPAGTHRLLPLDVEMLLGASTLLLWVCISRRAQRWLTHPSLLQLGRMSMSTCVTPAAVCVWIALALVSRCGCAHCFGGRYLVHMPLLIHLGSAALVASRDWLTTGAAEPVLWLVPTWARYDLTVVAAAAVIAPGVAVAVWAHALVTKPVGGLVRRVGQRDRLATSGARAWLWALGAVGVAAAVLEASNMGKDLWFAV